MEKCIKQNIRRQRCVRMKIEDYNKYYIQGSDHYLIPKDEFKELFNEIINWKEESPKLQTTAND